MDYDRANYEATVSNDTVLEDLIEQPSPSGPYHPLDPKHPLHQDVCDHPEKYVAVPKDVWNQTVALAGQNYLHQWKEKVRYAAMGEKKYPCRHDCGEVFTNSSNRNRHEKNKHGKENGHES